MRDKLATIGGFATLLGAAEGYVEEKVDDGTLPIVGFLGTDGLHRELIAVERAFDALAAEAKCKDTSTVHDPKTAGAAHSIDGDKASKDSQQRSDQTLKIDPQSHLKGEDRCHG